VPSKLRTKKFNSELKRSPKLKQRDKGSILLAMHKLRLVLRRKTDVTAKKGYASRTHGMVSSRCIKPIASIAFVTYIQP
jgi:hypothetical protein